MRNLILVGVIGAVVAIGLACGRKEPKEPSQLNQAIQQRTETLKQYGM